MTTNKKKVVHCAFFAVRVVLSLTIITALALSIALAWRLAGGVASASGAILAGCATFLAMAGAVIVSAIVVNDL